MWGDLLLEEPVGLSYTVRVREFTDFDQLSDWWLVLKALCICSVLVCNYSGQLVVWSVVWATGQDGLAGSWKVILIHIMAGSTTAFMITCGRTWYLRIRIVSCLDESGHVLQASREESERLARCRRMTGPVVGQLQTKGSREPLPIDWITRRCWRCRFHIVMPRIFLTRLGIERQTSCDPEEWYIASNQELRQPT